MTTEKGIWILGNAVQDLTIDIDLQRLEPDNHGLLELMNFRGNDPLIAAGLVLQLIREGETVHEAQIYLKPQDDLQAEDLKGRKFYKLVGGRKYSLRPPDGNESPAEKSSKVRIPTKSIAWGGGGINVVNTIRSLSPMGVTPVHYSDIGAVTVVPESTIELAGVFISELLSNPRKLSQIKKILVQSKGKAKKGAIDEFTKLAPSLIREPAVGERLYRQFVSAMKDYSPQDNLEVYLTERHTSFAFWRSNSWTTIRNIAVASFTGKDNDVRNKIIFRGHRDTLGDEVAIEDITRKLLDESSECSVIMVNTIYDDKFYEAAFDIATKHKGKEVKLVFAMTDSVANRFKLKHLPEMRDQLEGATLIFNEAELSKYVAEDIGNDASVFADDLAKGRLPDIDLLKKLAWSLVKNLGGGLLAEIYITLGPYGSLGITPAGKIIYVGTFGGNQRPIYDTNGCGDAYAGAVTMLKCHKDPDGYLMKPGGHNAAIQEEGMILTMAVATAAAYAKATNPAGIVRATDVISLLRNEYIPCLEIAQLGQGGFDTQGAKDSAGRLAQPPLARRIDYKDELAKIIKE
ncbi:MAG: hypothetical protein JST85_06040 [Acidobacteria bacterium]|nr:hypothetical protein [Acidobacteriota bacterium]